MRVMWIGVFFSLLSGALYAIIFVEGTYKWTKNRPNYFINLFHPNFWTTIDPLTVLYTPTSFNQFAQLHVAPLLSQVTRQEQALTFKGNTAHGLNCDLLEFGQQATKDTSPLLVVVVWCMVIPIKPSEVTEVIWAILKNWWCAWITYNQLLLFAKHGSSKREKTNSLSVSASWYCRILLQTTRIHIDQTTTAVSAASIMKTRKKSRSLHDVVL